MSKSFQWIEVGCPFGKKLWDKLMDLFKDDQLDDGLPFFESIIHMCLRFLTMAFIIPAWVFLGIVTMGWLWPPQIREFIFSSPVSKGITEEADELRKTQTLKLKNEIDDIHLEALQKSDAMHEVPGFTGDLARVVQATFIGYSEDDGEILVWS